MFAINGHCHTLENGLQFGKINENVNVKKITRKVGFPKCPSEVFGLSLFERLKRRTLFHLLLLV